MVLGFIRRLFKNKKTYVLNGDAFKTEDDSVVFEKPSGTTPKLISTSPLSPLMWRFIFPRSPAHPVDCEDGEQTVSRRTYTRASTTSSAGYGSQASDDSIPRLGASSVCGESSQIEVFSSKESSPIPEVRTKSYWGTPADSPVVGRYTLPAVTESSPIGEAPGIWGKPIFTPAADHETLSLEPSTVKRVEFNKLHAGRTPANMHNVQCTPATLPPKTPYRFDVKRLEVRGRKIPSAPKDEVDSPVEWSDARDAHFREEQPPTVSYEVGTPATLPPKTPYRGEVLRHEMRRSRRRISMPAMEFLEEDDEECSSSGSDSSAVVGASIWGEPDYSPASSTELDTSHTHHSCTPYRSTFARLESHKIWLRRMPSAPISGRVRQMVQFFENDSMRVEIPRRLDQAPPEFMRSCPQMDITPSPPRPVHGHTHSDRVRGVTSASERCIRCHVHNRTPTSRRSMG